MKAKSVYAVTKVGESLMWQGFRPNMIDKIEKV